MKKLTISMFLLIGGLMNAQTFTIAPSRTISSVYGINDFGSEYIFVKNNTGSTMSVSFAVVKNTFTANNWHATLCTHTGCFPNVPTSGLLGNLTDGSQGFFNIHVGFDGHAGVGEIKFYVYETSNPSNSDTITFDYMATTSIGVDENTLGKELSIFPNPTTDFVKVSGIDLSNEQYSTRITSTDGKVNIANAKAILTENGYDVSGFSEGIYFIEILKNDEPIFSSKFIKL